MNNFARRSGRRSRIRLLPGVHFADSREPRLDVRELGERHLRCLAYMSDEASVRSASVRSRRRRTACHRGACSSTAAKRRKFVSASSTLPASGSPMPIIWLQDSLERERPELRREVRGVPELPARHVGAAPLVARQEPRLGLLRREVLHDRPRLGEHEVAVDERRHRAVGVERQVLRPLVLALGEVEVLSSSWSPSTAAVSRTRRTFGDSAFM